MISLSGVEKLRISSRSRSFVDKMLDFKASCFSIAILDLSILLHRIIGKILE